MIYHCVAIGINRQLEQGELDLLVEFVRVIKSHNPSSLIDYGVTEHQTVGGLIDDTVPPIIITYHQESNP